MHEVGLTEMRRTTDRRCRAILPLTVGDCCRRTANVLKAKTPLIGNASPGASQWVLMTPCFFSRLKVKNINITVMKKAKNKIKILMFWSKLGVIDKKNRKCVRAGDKSERPRV